MSKFYSASPKDDYFYYVEGFRHPTTAPENKNIRCGRVTAGPPKYRPPHNVMHRPYSSTYNQILYCNPKFTADSSQATLPFEGEVEDPRLNAIRGKSVHYHLPTSKCVTNVHHRAAYLPSSQPYFKNPPPIFNNPHVEVYDSAPITRQNYTFPPHHNDYHTTKQYQSNHCSDTEGTLSEAVVEEEYTESEDESPSNQYQQHTYTKFQVNANASDNYRRADDTVRPSIKVESTAKHLNEYNRSLPDKKINPQDLETLVRRLKKEPVSDDRYIYKKSRCLESSYEKAAEILRQAKGKVQNAKPENKTNGYEQYRRKQYSQLLLEDSAMRLNRETALARDASGNVFLGCQKHVKQISSQYSLIKPNSFEINTELRCSPIPEEQQLDAEIKGEKPVKLQKELSVPLQFSSKGVFQAQSEKSHLAQKDKLPILHRSKRIPRRKRNVVGIRSCAKALKKFTEFSQIAIQKQPVIPLTHVSENPDGQKIHFSLNAHEKTTDKRQPPSRPQSRDGTRQNDNLWNSSNKLTSLPPPKTEVTLNVKNMISKLDEIENLINRKKTCSPKCESSTSPSSINIDESTNTAHISSGEILLSKSQRSGKKTRKSSRSGIPQLERDEAEDSDPTVKPEAEKNIAESIRTASFASTKSMIASLVSAISTKILSTNNSKYYDSTDAKIFRSIFEPGSRDTTRNGDSCSFSLQSHRRQVAFDSSSGSDRNRHISDKTVSRNINRYSRKKSTKSPKKESSVVTVFPAYRRNIDFTAESASTNVTSDMIPEESDRPRKVSKIPRLKRRGKADDSSSDNTSYIVRPKYKGRRRLSNVQSVSEDNRLTASSAFSTLRSAFCIIIDFLFRYFKNLFIL